MSDGEEFLHHLWGGCWDELCDRGRYFINNKEVVREALHTLKDSYQHEFKPNFNIVIEPLVERIIAEFGPLMDGIETRLPLRCEKSKFKTVISEIYEADKEYWDSVFS